MMGTSTNQANASADPPNPTMSSSSNNNNNDSNNSNTARLVPSQAIHAGSNNRNGKQRRAGRGGRGGGRGKRGQQHRQRQHSPKNSSHETSKTEQTNGSETSSSLEQANTTQQQQQQQQQKEKKPPARRQRKGRNNRKRQDDAEDEQQKQKQDVTDQSDQNSNAQSTSVDQRKKRNRKRRQKKKLFPWRKFIPKGSVDPITLEPLVSLPYPPFALCADQPYQAVVEWPPPSQDSSVAGASSSNQTVDREAEILKQQWGSHVVLKQQQTLAEQQEQKENEQTMTATPLHERVFNLFDGKALAYYMVSQLQFIDPFNRRDLNRSELVALDTYLNKHFGREAAVVVEAHDTQAAGTSDTVVNSAGASATTAEGRAALLQQQARQLLHALFANGGASNPNNDASHSTGGGGGGANSLAQQYAASQQRQRQQQQQQPNRRNARQQGEPDDAGIYGQGGLLVIDNDLNPGLRGGLHSETNDTSEDRMSPSAQPFEPGTLWSASHIRDRFSHAATIRAAEFPELGNASVNAERQESSPPRQQQQQAPASRSLQKMTKLVAKTNPRELEKQRQARELFVKRAMMANLRFGAEYQDPFALQQQQQQNFLLGGRDSAPTEGQVLRNQAVASALGVVPATARTPNAGWARPVTHDDGAHFEGVSVAQYPDSLILAARERMEFVLKLERKWKTFLQDDSAASLPLNKMDRPTRIFCHEYSDFWKLHTESFDPEPRRYIHCVKLRDTRAPRPLLSEAARNWRGPRIPNSNSENNLVYLNSNNKHAASDHAMRQTAGQTPREFPPPPDREPLVLKPRSGVEHLASATVATKTTMTGANARSNELFVGRERPKLELAPRTLPLELPPPPKDSKKEQTSGMGLVERQRLQQQKQQMLDERKQRIIESAFASDDEEQSLRSHDSADWEGLDEEQVPLYSGSDEEDETLLNTTVAIS